MEDIVVLEWTYDPPDFFEQTLTVNETDYELEIESGAARARISVAKFNNDGSTRNEIHTSLDHRFRAVQAMTHQSYELTAPSQYRQLPDGRKHYWLFANSGMILIQGHPADIVVKDSDGNVIADSRSDRLKLKREIAERVATVGKRNVLLAAILDSYSNAVNDADDELVHLYEIRDALASHFGNEKTARQDLSISKRRWSRLGQLANDEPIKQGRHRGRATANLRDATVDELNECRDIAFEMITKYLDYAEARP